MMMEPKKFGETQRV